MSADYLSQLEEQMDNMNKTIANLEKDKQVMSNQSFMNTQSLTKDEERIRQERDLLQFENRQLRIDVSDKQSYIDNLNNQLNRLQ
jgi:uncharacterized protein YoxC